MSYLLLLAGLVIVVLIFYDLVQTALRMSQHGGPLTLHLASHMWSVALRFPRLIERAGVVIVLSIVGAWALFSWLGWSLVFASWETSVIATDTKSPADLVGKVYFAGYTIFTLGNGDYAPTGAWRLVTVVANAGGLVMVTLAITYLAPLLSAVVEKRALAGRISVLGRTVEELVRKLTSSGADEVRTELSFFPNEVLLLKERHIAYPVMHYFQSRDRDASIALNLAVLSEALTVVCDGAEDPDPLLTAAAEKIRGSVERLVDALEPWFMTDEPETPAPPSLDILRKTGVRSRSPDSFIARVQERNDVRRQLRWMVEDTGSSWPTASTTLEEARGV